MSLKGKVNPSRFKPASVLVPARCLNYRWVEPARNVTAVLHMSSLTEFQRVRKERDALQKQVQLINGQLNLMEGSKKRSDDTAQRTQDELAQLRSQLETSRKEWVIFSCPKYPALFLLLFFSCSASTHKNVTWVQQERTSWHSIFFGHSRPCLCKSFQFRNGRVESVAKM